MKSFPKLIILGILMFGCTAQQLQQTLDSYLGSDQLTTEEVANGLKEALIKGISEGSASASKLNGYLGNPQIKIPFPPDVQKVEDKLRSIGLDKQVDQFIETLNRGAEEAARGQSPYL